MQSLSSNWSCILYKEQIVIHSEESDVAHQYFYPISVLQRHARPSSPSPSFVPSISERLPPITTMTASFIFPPQTRVHTPASVSVAEEDPADADANIVDLVAPVPDGALNGDANGDANGNGNENGDGNTEDGDDNVSVSDGNPFPYPPWYPESAHFVRQWWPTLSSVPRLSCTVVLLADHEPETHRTRYVLAQHYFKVPLIEADEVEQIAAAAPKAVAMKHGYSNGNGNANANSNANGGGVSPSSSISSDGTLVIHMNLDSDDVADPPPQPEQRSAKGTPESSMMRLWYVSEPFEVVCVLDGMDDELDPDGSAERPRPLMAVDFGHAVWIEFKYPPELDRDEKRLRFVTFPPVTNDRDAMDYGGPGATTEESLEGIVRTLEVPDELDLDAVETINIDQSQGAIIISVKDGKIFILCYE